MGSEHQALLEAMEQQSISVAKAGIGRLLVYNASANAGANAGANVCVIVYDVQPH